MLKKKRPPQLVVDSADASKNSCVDAGNAGRARPFFPRGSRKDSLRSLDKPALSPAAAQQQLQNQHTAPAVVSSAGDPARFWAVSRRGTKRSVCEDKWSVFPLANRPLDAQPGALFGVFDGHGGVAVSELCKQQLLGASAANLVRQHMEPADAMKAAFAQVDARVAKALAPPSSSAVSSSPSQPCGSSSSSSASICGSTATAVWFRQGMLHVGFVGDSRVVLGTADGRALELTRDHRATCIDEVERIEKNGGFVLMNRVNGVLSISRAIGDVSLKKFVTAEPETITRVLHPLDQLLIVATDGLWDVVSSQQAIDYASRRFALQSNSGHAGNHASTLESIASGLVDLALESGSTDDITVMVIDIAAHRSELVASPGSSSRIPRWHGSVRMQQLEMSCRLHRNGGGAAASTAAIAPDMWAPRGLQSGVSAEDESSFSKKISYGTVVSDFSSTAADSGDHGFPVEDFEDFSLSSVGSLLTNDDSGELRVCRRALAQLNSDLIAVPDKEK